MAGQIGETQRRACVDHVVTEHGVPRVRRQRGDELRIVTGGRLHVQIGAAQEGDDDHAKTVIPRQPLDQGHEARPETRRPPAIDGGHHRSGLFERALARGAHGGCVSREQLLTDPRRGEHPPDRLEHLLDRDRLCRNARAPRRRASSRYPSNPEFATTAGRSSGHSRRKRSRNSRPSSSGIIMSRKITSGRSFFARSSPTTAFRRGDHFVPVEGEDCQVTLQEILTVVDDEHGSHAPPPTRRRLVPTSGAANVRPLLRSRVSHVNGPGGTRKLTGPEGRRSAGYHTGGDEEPPPPRSDQDARGADVRPEPVSLVTRAVTPPRASPRRSSGASRARAPA